MTFNEFVRELERRDIPKQTAYMLTLMFERQTEAEKQLLLCTKLLEGLVQTVANFTLLHEATQGQVQQLMRMGRPDGIEVHSVVNDPDETS